jgi:hypothetical protein
MSMSNWRAMWLAACLSIPLASCALDAEGELDDPSLSEEAEATEPAAQPTSLEAGEEELACTRWQCQPCQPPSHQVTAQRTYTECGAHDQVWEVIYLCSSC